MPYFCLCTGSSYVKLFGKAQVDVNLSLGQFVKVNYQLLSLLCAILSQDKLNENKCDHADNPFLVSQSRNIDNEFDFQQLAYFKTRIGVSNSFQVR